MPDQWRPIKGFRLQLYHNADMRPPLGVRYMSAPALTPFFLPQLPGEWRGGDAAGGCAATSADAAAVGPAPGGHACVGQLQYGDTG